MRQNTDRKVVRNNIRIYIEVLKIKLPSIILIIGKTSGHLYQSEFFREVMNFKDGNPPEINLFNEKNNGLTILNLISKKLLRSVHDISSGGILVALSEMCYLNNIGVTIEVPKKNIKLHMIGKLQTNKVKFAVKIFNYIHSVDSEKLAKKISEEQIKINKKVKIFIQVNIGDEDQKSGVKKNDLKNFVSYCKKIDLDILGLMCIPPIGDLKNYFKKMSDLNKSLGLNELSMGMSADYLNALKYNATFIRIGSSIFGQRN